VIIVKSGNPSAALLKKVKEINTREPDASTGSMHIDIYEYSIFQIVTPRHILCTKHRIVNPSEEEYSYFEEYMQVRPDKFSRISVNDPQCIWIGAKVGDIIETRLISERADDPPEYKLCVPGPQL
jgi:DNA-directed RNA polymerase subunit H (RpoH/RPB5)